MAKEGDKWRVVKGDCLWNISKSVYGTPYKWQTIANANGVSTKTALIYPGQLLTLPGITAGTSGASGSTTPAPNTNLTKVSVQWWALDAGETRKLFCTWTHTREHTAGYKLEVWYDTGQGGWRFQGDATTTYEVKQYSVSFPQEAKKVMLKIKPYASTHEVTSGKTTTTVEWWTDGQWVEVTYDFANNPPLTPSTPTVDLNPITGKLTCSLSNIDEDINGNQIEFYVYNNNTTLAYKGIGNINATTRYVSYSWDVEPGGSYTVKCRAIRGGNIYSNWSDYTDPVKTIPISPSQITELRPQVISEQGSKQYGVYIEWTSVSTAKNYEIQYVTDPTYFDISSNVESVTTDETQGNKALIIGIELGHEYFFRVRAVNDSGNSGWTPIKTTTLGSKPSAPTTWSNTQNCTTDEILKIYWTHNSTDGSLESVARIHFTIQNTMYPELEPLEFDKVVRNTRPEEDKGKTSSYEIDPSDSQWGLSEGCIIKYKVQTAGVVEEYSDWSIEREVNVYLPPQLEIDTKNQNGQSLDTIIEFPFYISVSATPRSQIPISYYIEIVANQGYETVDEVGKRMVVNSGDKVYQRYFDPSDQAWEFLAEMTPGNVDLQSGISYTVNATVSMNSGLSATNSKNFDIEWNDIFYTVDADIILSKESLEANIHPYCNEYYEDEETGEILPKLTENCMLSVYRREYDGTFTLVASDIDNNENTWVLDPHPSLDYARYRIVAVSKDTGSISFGDIAPVRFGEPSLVIQWAEEWTKFETSEEIPEQPAYTGSMIKIPYNIDIKESARVDTEVVEYVGRKHPVSYYGTQVNESFTGNCEIPREDTNMIYELRRLAKWAGDVYVREPSGLGYWATVGVSFDLKHNEVTVPVSFSITRVEGGI